MGDEQLRALERRWQESGDSADEAQYLRALLRNEALPSERLRLAAFLGHPAARAALGGEAPAPLKLPWWTPLFPNRGLRTWLELFAPSGAEACMVAAESAAILAKDDWSRLAGILDIVFRAERFEHDPSDVLNDAALAAAEHHSPAQVIEAMRGGVVSWCLDRPHPTPNPPRVPQEWGQGTRGKGEAPIDKLVDRVLEDACERGSTSIRIDQEDDVARVCYREGEEPYEERMRIPPFSLRGMIARLKYMAGLDVLQRGPQEGRFRFRYTPKEAGTASRVPVRIVTAGRT